MVPAANAIAIMRSSGPSMMSEKRRRSLSPSSDADNTVKSKPRSTALVTPTGSSVSTRMKDATPGVRCSAWSASIETNAIPVIQVRAPETKPTTFSSPPMTLMRSPMPRSCWAAMTSSMAISSPDRIARPSLKLHGPPMAPGW